MQYKAYKGYIASPENRTKVIIGLYNYPAEGELSERNQAIINDVLVEGVPTDIVAQNHGISVRMVQVVVSSFLSWCKIGRGRNRESVRGGVDRDAVYRRYKKRCALCGFSVKGVRGGGNSVHHIRPVSEGGGNEPDNLILICPNCHMLAHAGKIGDDTLRRAAIG